MKLTGDLNDCAAVAGLRFWRTCHACPEQYDVTWGTEQVGYVRLRGGHLQAHAPGVSGEMVLEHRFDNDIKGGFDSEEEREGWVLKCTVALLEWRKRRETGSGIERWSGRYRFVERQKGRRETHDIYLGWQRIATFSASGVPGLLCYGRDDLGIAIGIGGDEELEDIDTFGDECDRREWIDAAAHALEQALSSRTDRALKDTSKHRHEYGVSIVERTLSDNAPIEADIIRDGKTIGYIMLSEYGATARSPDQGGRTVFECVNRGVERAMVKPKAWIDECAQAIATQTEGAS